MITGGDPSRAASISSNARPLMSGSPWSSTMRSYCARRAHSSSSGPNLTCRCRTERHVLAEHPRDDRHVIFIVFNEQQPKVHRLRGTHLDRPRQLGDYDPVLAQDVQRVQEVLKFHRLLNVGIRAEL